MRGQPPPAVQERSSGFLPWPGFSPARSQVFVRSYPECRVSHAGSAPARRCTCALNPESSLLQFLATCKRAQGSLRLLCL
jgi:hypothetical protein